MIVCVCRAVSDRTIRQAVTEGASTLEDVARKCGAGTCCGACVNAVATLIGRHGPSASPDCSPRAPAVKSDPAGGNP